MKKIIISILLLSSLVYAGLVNDGFNAYNHGNYREAVKLWKKAANQGDAEAQLNLGLMYDNGQGVKQNYVKAVKWWKKAANQGDAEAQNNLALMYDNGQGVKQNLSKAKELFGKACNGGIKSGCHNYKILNERGIQ